MSDLEKNEDIVQSPVALAMLQMVTRGFYDNSSIALWLFEVMGREYDEIATWSQNLHQEIFLQSCTWSVSIWEELMDIEPDDSLTLEMRQQRLLAKALHRAPINPEVIRMGVVALTGCEDVVIDELYAPYSFSVTVNHTKEIPNMGEVWEYIYGIKPSQLSFRLFFVHEHPVFHQYNTGGKITSVLEKELPYLERDYGIELSLSAGGISSTIVEITLEEVVAQREISSILCTASKIHSITEKVLEEIPIELEDIATVTENWNQEEEKGGEDLRSEENRGETMGSLVIPEIYEVPARHLFRIEDFEEVEQGEEIEEIKEIEEIEEDQ